MGAEACARESGNAGLVEQYGDAVMPREHEWDSRWWSPIINAEHLRMREAAGVIDLTAFQIFDIEGAGALDSVQRTIRKHRGYVRVQSEPGATCFQIRLPIEQLQAY